MASGLDAEAAEPDGSLESRLARRSTWTPEVYTCTRLEIVVCVVCYGRKTSDKHCLSAAGGCPALAAGQRGWPDELEPDSTSECVSLCRHNELSGGDLKHGICFPVSLSSRLFESLTLSVPAEP